MKRVRNLARRSEKPRNQKDKVNKHRVRSVGGILSVDSVAAKIETSRREVT